MKAEDFIGKKFGMLEVLGLTEKKDRSYSVLECLCDCGDICYKTTKYLRSVETPNCGCLNNIVGNQYGSILVLEKTDMRDKKYNVIYKCQCDCGNECFLSRGAILKPYKNKHFPHCGCLSYNKQKPEQWIWSEIKSRCYRSTHPEYHRYGGRGITMFEEWIGDFIAFYKWLRSNIGLKPSQEYTLDRIDNDGNYEPGNLRWATRVEQVRNSTTVRFTIDDVKDIKRTFRNRTCGIQECVYQLCDKYNAPKSSIENIIYERSWKDVQP